MNTSQFLIISTILAIGMATITGCSEDEEESAQILETDPANGDIMFLGSSLTINFDKPVSKVTVNEVPASVDGTKATWESHGATIGKQTLLIKWTDENGNAGSQEITLTIQQTDTIVCLASYRAFGKEL